MLWRCPKLHRYWESILDTLNSLCSTQVQPVPKIALLGVIQEVVLPVEVHVMWLRTRTMYMARKRILQKWVSNCPPMTDQWIKTITSNLRLEELT